MVPEGSPERLEKRLGTLLGALGPLLGRSWALLVRSWSALGPLLRRFWAPEMGNFRETVSSWALLDLLERFWMDF